MIRKLILAAMFMTAAAYGQFGGATARHIGGGASLPAACSPNTGDIYTVIVIGVSSTPYFCDSPNHWALFGGGGGSGVTSLAGTANQITVSAATGAVTLSFPTGGVTLPGTTTLANPLAPGQGGTGIGNTATLRLGTSNQNWATLGTGIVKNTTTTGAISDAVSSDVYGLWTGTGCGTSTNILLMNGNCGTPAVVTGGTCTNQVVTVISVTAVPTCTTVTSAYVDSSVVIGGNSITTQFLIPVASGTTGTLAQSTMKLNATLLYPSADSTTAFQIRASNGTTVGMDFDSTNNRFGFGAVTAPAQTIDVGTGSIGVTQLVGHSGNFLMRDDNQYFAMSGTFNLSWAFGGSSGGTATSDICTAASGVITFAATRASCVPGSAVAATIATLGGGTYNATSSSVVALGFNNAANFGFLTNGGNTVLLAVGGSPGWYLQQNAVGQGSGGILTWSSNSSGGGSNVYSNLDSGIDRDAAGSVGVTNGTPGTTAANYRSVKASAYLVGGTTFTLSANGCTATTLVGGATRGSYVSGTTGNCTVTILMGNSVAAATGFHCTFEDHTTLTVATGVGLLSQTGAADTTHCSMTGVTASGDLVSFSAEPY